MRLLHIQLVMLAVASAAWTAEPRSEYEAGRQQYLGGNFKKAAAHFRQAVRADAADADAHFWLGKSYAVLGDIGMPFRGGASAKAYSCLARAVELAPDRAEYRRELFEFLLDAADYSATPLHKAVALLQSTPAADPQFAEMSWRLDREYEERPANLRRPGFFFIAAPQRIDRVVEWRTHPHACGN